MELLKLYFESHRLVEAALGLFLFFGGYLVLMISGVYIGYRIDKRRESIAENSDAIIERRETYEEWEDVE